MNQQQTQSEHLLQDRSDEFDSCMKFLSELPTDRAMQELSKGRPGPAAQKVCETMALHKEALVRGLRLMRMTNRAMFAVLNANKKADDVILKWCQENPNHRIDLVATTPEDPERIIHD